MPENEQNRERIEREGKNVEDETTRKPFGNQSGQSSVSDKDKERDEGDTAGKHGRMSPESARGLERESGE